MRRYMQIYDRPEETVSETESESPVRPQSAETDAENETGTKSDGSKSNGSESDGSESDGSESDERESDGSKSDGRESDGSESDGRESGGRESDGSESDGRESDGRESGGRESDGKESDGRESDESESDGSDSDSGSESEDSDSSDESQSGDPVDSGPANVVSESTMVNEPTHRSPAGRSFSRKGNNHTAVQHSSIVKNPSDEAANERMDRIEKVLESVTSVVKSLQTYDRPTPYSSHRETEPNWVAFNASCVQERNPTSIRWDNIHPFPSGIPSNKMWEEWNRYIENFEIAASLSNANDPAKRTQLLFLSMGPDLQEIVKAAKLRPNLADASCYKTFVANINNYFRAMTDTAAEHEAFTSMKQERDESAVAFHARLMCKVRLCGYSNDDQDRFVRAQLLKGLRNKMLVRQARTYGYETNYIVQAATRDEAYEAETARTTEDHVCQIGRRNTSNNNYLKRRNPNAFNREPPAKRQQVDHTQGQRSRCSRCNLSFHKYGRCPASDKKCLECGRLGHFALVCQSKRVNAMRFKRDASSERDDPGHGKGDDDKQHINALSLDDVLIDCSVGSASSIRFLIDSGADVNVVCGKDWDRIEREYRSGAAKLEIVNQKNKEIHAYGSKEPLSVERTFKARIVVPNTNKPAITAIFHVIRKGLRSLLGRSTANDLHLLQVGTAVNVCEIANEKKEFPRMPGVTVRFNVDKTVAPVKNAYYNVPAAYREAARRRLHEMEERGIIEKVTTAPTWISGMSAVPKGKNDFRLVVNMRAPNRAINREYFRLPLIDEMKIKLHGAKYFSKLDLSNAFYHLTLSEESRDLTTFLSEDGMYRFTRLMFGVNCAPEVFQREMVRILKGSGKLIVYIDDVLIYATTLEELRETVAKVLLILKENKLTVNEDKCEFDKTRIKFLGHELDENGFHIDEEKIKSIQNFREPATLSELRSFLGLASFISPYIPNFADMTTPLWAATSSKSWTWGSEQRTAFNRVKEQIVQCTTALGYFSDTDRTILYTDASKVALGAVLVQESATQSPRIISFGSKALTSTEKDYAQNQREALGAVWAVEHFRYFLLGRHFTLRTDAQGVAFILNRSREDSKRAQTRAYGWALRLSPYSYDVEYVRGRDNIADSNSRLYCGVDDPFDEDVSPWEIACLEANSIEFLTEDDIKDGTKHDKTLQKVTNALQTGEWSDDLRKYKMVKNDLSVRNGIVIKTGCAVIPENLRIKALQVAHEGHPTIAKMKSIIRQRVWWPGISTDVQNWVQSCKTCALTGRPEKTTPMERVFLPNAVWETIALDFNGPYVKFGGISILLIVDYRSRYLIAKPVKSTTFEFTKKILEEVFDREGFPKFIKSDNGPPFNGDDYKRYCAERGITTLYSTPLFPQQNGMVESYMKVVNKAMATASSNKTSFVEELREAINAYNAASHSVTKVPPEEVMLGRKVQRGLPLLQHAKASYDEKIFETADRESKISGKNREDARRGAKPCKVKPGDTVVVERHNRAKGETRFHPKRYTVEQEKNGSLVLNDEDGQELKRHVSQTKRVHQWRDDTAHEARTRISTTGAGTEEPIRGKQAGTTDDTTAKPDRNIRKRKAPSYLSDYVRLVQDEQISAAQQ